MIWLSVTDFNSKQMTKIITKITIATCLVLNTFTITAQELAKEKVTIFGGIRQYRTWSLGINAGILSPVVFTGGSNDFKNWESNLGYGLSLAKQLSPSFSIKGNVLQGEVSASNVEAPGGILDGYRNYTTKIAYAADLRGEVTLGTLNFRKRELSLSFQASAGMGLTGYAPKVTDADNRTTDWKGQVGTNGNKEYVKGLYMPVGASARFRVSEIVSFILGYSMSFLDGDNLDGVYKGGKDKFSYSSAGLDFLLGNRKKAALAWHNPVAAMYDELNDPTLRGELKSLETRITEVENIIKELEKDTDGDGVTDHFDRCADSPADGTADGRGCPIMFISN